MSDRQQHIEVQEIEKPHNVINVIDMYKLESIYVVASCQYQLWNSCTVCLS